MTVLENWKESLSSEDVNRFILFGLECQDCPATNHCDYPAKDNGKKLCEDHEAFQSFLDGEDEDYQKMEDANHALLKLRIQLGMMCGQRITKRSNDDEEKTFSEIQSRTLLPGHIKTTEQGGTGKTVFNDGATINFLKMVQPVTALAVMAQCATIAPITLTADLASELSTHISRKTI